MNVDTMALQAGADRGFCTTVWHNIADRAVGWHQFGQLNGFPRNKALTIRAAIGRHQSSSRLLPFLGGLWHFLVSSSLPGISIGRD